MDKEEQIIVLPKCKRCRIKASANDICQLCQKELEALRTKNYDHHFWGLDAARPDEAMYFIRIYHDCDDLQWLIGRNISIDLDDGERKARGKVKNAESMQTPPYRSGDLVTVMLEAG